MATTPAKKKSQKPNKGKQSQGTAGISKEWLIVGGILLLTFIAFFPSLSDGFVNWDDFNYVRDNAIIKDLSGSNIAHIFNTSTYVMGNYHPLTVLTYCFEYALFKLDPFYYHLDNILLHLVNIILVYVFFKMLLSFHLPPAIKEKGNTPQLVAVITALLFAIHPLRVESVTWVAERKDVLYTLFFLGSLIYYLQYLKFAKTKFYVLSILFFLFSILSKGQAVVLAPVLLLVDYFIKKKFDQKTILEKIPFFLLALIFGIIAMKAQHTSLTTERLASHTPLERLMIASYGLVMYLYKFIAPINLACFYQYPDKLSGFFYIAPVVVLGLAFGVWRLVLNARRSDSNLTKDLVTGTRANSKLQTPNALLFGTLFFFFTISIVLQLLPVGDAVIAERYTYIPFIGLFFLVSSLYVRLLELKPNMKTALQVGGAVIMLFFFVQTFSQAKVWKNSTTLWSSLLERYPETPVAFNNRGQSYFDMPGQLDKLIESFKVERDNAKRSEIAEEMSSKFGMNAEDINNPDKVKKVKDVFYQKAFDDFNKALVYKKDYSYALKNRGAVFQNLKQYDLAVADYKKAIELSPGFSSAMFNLGLNYVDAGKPDSAIMYYIMAEKYEPDNPEIYYSKGIAYKQTGKMQEALENYSIAIQKNPRYTEAYDNRGNVYFNLGQFDRAIEDYTLSINMDANNARAFSNRSMAYYSKKDFKSALADAMQSQALGNAMDPRYLEILKAGK